MAQQIENELMFLSVILDFITVTVCLTEYKV